MDTYIKGTYKRKIFASNDGFVVGLLKIKETNDQDLMDYKDKLFTFTGLFAELKIDENYVFYGNLIDNPKYGIQYKVNKYEKIMPEDKDGLILFLSSDIFPGVGEVTAKLIVDALGENALNEIIDNYENLLVVPKMTEKKAMDIQKRLLKYNESFEIVVYLTNFGFSMKDALKIYNHYLEDTIRVIENNPYELIDTIDGITFLKIDELRSKTKILENDERRLLALILYVMQNLCFQTGDTYLSFDLIKNGVNVIYQDKMSDDALSYYLIELNSLGKIIIENDKYILYNYYKDEDYISNACYYLSNKEDAIIENIDLKIERLEHFFEINYNDEQKKAIKQALIKNFSIITGGPGTGKTTIIKGIVQLYKMLSGFSYEKLTEKLVLLAPTGRAAKRMSEACSYPSSTIHRYLKWNKETGEFFYNERNKASAQFVIVDETSMIDVELLANFFKAIKKDVKLVFIGDYNQLESVGPGNVLKDLIESDVINTIFLKEIYRQDQNSFITELAYEVNNGELDESFLSKKDDYNFIKCSGDDVLKVTCMVAKRAVEKGYDLKNVQVLAPIYKGVNGIDNLNKVLQSIFNPKSDDKKEVYDADVTYREGDKVLQLENMPDVNVFNGDIGFIEKIDKNEITVNFDGNKVKYTKKEYKAIKHGYAISIHKAQGSEFEIVIMPVTHSYYGMLYRKIVYTGITRAKKSLTLIGDPASFSKAVYNKGNKQRKTLLKEMLISNIS
jgi:exodeoxyribonuclease V alpha subunit